MQLIGHDLSQLDEEEFLNLPEELLRRPSIKLLNDLKEARERLNQNSRNSSRPPSSEVPWENEVIPNDTIDEAEEKQSTENADKKASKPFRYSIQELCGTYKGKVNGVTLGCVDGDPQIELEMPVFVGSKASWETLPRRSSKI